MQEVCRSIDCSKEGDKAVIARRLLLLLFTLFSLFVIPTLLYSIHHTLRIPEWDDFLRGHLPQINYFVQHPFSIFHSETTSTFPGHHLFLAYVARVLQLDVVQESSISIRLVNALIAYGLLGVVWHLVWRMCKNPWLTFAMVLPIACTHYVISAAIWIGTDNGAVLFYALILSCFILQEIPSIAGVGLFVFLMVLWRQMYLPVILAFGLRAFFSAPIRKAVHFAIFASLPALLLVAIFYWQWGGFTTPEAQHLSQFHLINPLLYLHAMALTGLLGIPYLPLFYSEKKVGILQQVYIVLASVMIASLIWFISPVMNFDTTTLEWTDWGHITGSIIWKLAKVSQANFQIYGKSGLVWLLAVVGNCILGLMVQRAIKLRYFPMELAMFIFYVVGYSLQALAYQRYIEPALLVTYAVYGARLRSVTRIGMLIPAILYFMYGLLSMLYFVLVYYSIIKAM